MSLESREKRTKLLTGTVLSCFESPGQLTDKCAEPKLVKTGYVINQMWLGKALNYLYSPLLSKQSALAIALTYYSVWVGDMIF